MALFEGMRSTALVLLLPTVLSAVIVCFTVDRIGFFWEKSVRIESNRVTGNIEQYCTQALEIDSSFMDDDEYSCSAERDSYYLDITECVCGNLDGVRRVRLAAYFLVLCVSAYATRSLLSPGRLRLNKTMRAKSDARRSVTEAAAECRKEIGIEGEVVYHDVEGEQPSKVWENMVGAAADPFQRKFYKWALERQPTGVALGPTLNLSADVRYPSLTHHLSGRSFSRLSFVYVGEPLDSAKCWVFANGEVGTLAGHQGLFLTNVGVVKFTRLQYRSITMSLAKGSWILINNQAVEEDVFDAVVALTGWSNTLLSLVGFVAGGSSAWSASLGINAATEVMAGLVYTTARGNAPIHEKIRGYVDPLLSSFRGPALLGSWAWVILSLESLGAILSVFALAVGGTPVAAALALLVGFTGSIGTLPSMSGRVALVGSMLSWYSTEFIIEVYGLFTSDERPEVKLAFASGALESCLLLLAYYNLLSCANAISHSTGVDAVVRMGNRGVSAIPAVGLAPVVRGSCQLFGLRASAGWPRGRVRSWQTKDLTVEGLATGTELELHDPDVPHAGYEAYVMGPSLPRDACSVRGWTIPSGWGGYGCVVVRGSLVPVL